MLEHLSVCLERVGMHAPNHTPDVGRIYRTIHDIEMQQYARHAYRLTLLEIQKLAYFLQESGLDLRLRYVKHLYGPYAHNLNKVLEVLEGPDHIRVAWDRLQGEGWVPASTGTER